MTYGDLDIFTKSNSNSSPSQVVIVIFFAKPEKSFSNSSLSHVAIYPKLGKHTPHAHICAQRSMAHPPILEELEGYKNNFGFLRIPDLSF
jgi:hypothetical protein